MTQDANPRIRRGRRNANYTAISNAIINHPSLSPYAKLALIYLLSKPDDWRLQINDLRRVLGCGGKACGRNKAYEVLNELKLTAYVKATTTTEGGRFSGVTYYVYDEPYSETEEDEGASKSSEIEAPSAASQPPPKPSKSPCPGIREAVATPRPGFGDAEKGDLTKERFPQKTEIPPPSPRIRDSAAAALDLGEGSGFSNFWEAWPEAERPREKTLAGKRFLALTSRDRELATKFAAAFRNASNQRGEVGRMMPYLGRRLFAEFEGEPELTPEGRFRITPGTPEWEAWKADYATRVKQSIWAAQEEVGFLDCPTRWPTSPEDASRTGSGRSSVEPRRPCASSSYDDSGRAS